MSFQHSYWKFTYKLYAQQFITNKKFTRFCRRHTVNRLHMYKNHHHHNLQHKMIRLLYTRSSLLNISREHTLFLLQNNNYSKTLFFQQKHFRKSTVSLTLKCRETSSSLQGLIIPIRLLDHKESVDWDQFRPDEGSLGRNWSQLTERLWSGNRIGMI